MKKQFSAAEWEELESIIDVGIARSGGVKESKRAHLVRRIAYVLEYAGEQGIIDLTKQVHRRAVFEKLSAPYTLAKAAREYLDDPRPSESNTGNLKP